MGQDRRHQMGKSKRQTRHQKVVKLEPKEQGKAEADDAQVLGIMKDETIVRPAFHKRLIDYIYEVV